MTIGHRIRNERRSTMGFGPNLYVEGITLRKLYKREMGIVADGFSDMHVHMYTSLLFAKTREDEEEWYERIRESETDCVWAIVPEGSESPVGVTAIHGIDHFATCRTGFAVWEDSLWGQGIATRAHLARTLYAADFLARRIIYSSVCVPNEASLKALLRCGYFVWGIQPFSVFRRGKYLPRYYLIWLHPERTREDELDELDPNMKQTAIEAMERERLALFRAREVVKLKE